MTLLLLLACAPEGPWTRDAALGPTLARLDRDRDGRVVAAEYDAVAFHAPPFAQADADHDGALSLAELDHLVASQDPLVFEAGRREPGLVAPVQGTPFAVGKGSQPAGLVWLLLREDLLAQVPDAEVPTVEQIEATGQVGPDAPESRAVRDALAAAYDRAGKPFPAVLR